MMMRDDYFYEPAHGHGLAHDPLNAIVAPRPIGWISSHDADGRTNLAPYSFFNVFHYTPPILGFASNGLKHTVRNVQTTREFCWNLVTRDLAERMNTTSATVPADVSEFALAGLTPASSRRVSVPRVAETPVSFECRLIDVIQLHTADRAPLDGWLVLGEVVGVHIARTLLVDGTYRNTLAHPVLRGGGPSQYFEITADHEFHMRRPG